MQELSADSGTVVLARDKNIGYLAQYQDIHGHHTIYEELLTTKQHIIDMERRIRNMEQEMNTVTGDELNRLMETYTRLTHQFELENGYAYKSELTGVLKGLGFTEEDYDKQIETLSGGQKPAWRWARCFFPSRISCFWMSQLITWIWKASPGWKLIF